MKLNIFYAKATCCRGDSEVDSVCCSKLLHRALSFTNAYLHSYLNKY